MKLLTLYALFYALPLGLLISLIVKFFRHWRDREVAKAMQRQQVLAAAHRLPRPMNERASQGFSRALPQPQLRTSTADPRVGDRG
jgi:hypothetical protein